MQLEDIKEETEEEAKQWDFHSKTAFLTYADVNDWYNGKDPAEDMASDILNLFPDDISHLVIGFERYKESATRWHAHVYIEFIHKKRSRDCRFFDLYDMHPHIESAKQKNKVISYCSKNAYQGWPYYNNMKPSLATFQNFDRTQNNYERWQYKLSTLKLKPFSFPVSFYDHEFKLSFNDKRRHFYIYGPKDAGKSSEAGANKFDSLDINYFAPGASQNMQGAYGTFDAYEDQNLIIWEDRSPDWQTVQTICDFSGNRPRPDLVRCRGRMKLFKVKMTAIITSNYAPGSQFGQDWEKDNEAFKARFIIIEIEKNALGRGVIKRIS